MRHDEPVRDVRRQTTNQGPSFHVPAHLTVHSSFIPFTFLSVHLVCLGAEEVIAVNKVSRVPLLLPVRLLSPSPPCRFARVKLEQNDGYLVATVRSQEQTTYFLVISGSWFISVGLLRRYTHHFDSLPRLSASLPVPHTSHRDRARPAAEGPGWEEERGMRGRMSAAR